ncbi:MAG: hypothetical protein HY651_05395 [Acidobacteria bacterium]|nr:hypothetical protein [Acidobacteriota bacterium]
MLSPRMVSLFPLGIYDRPFSHFDDAIAGFESCRSGRLNKLHMRPLVAVIVYVVSNLAKENAFWLQDSESLFNKWRVGVRKAVAQFLRGTIAEPEASVKILGFVFSLIRDMGRIINDHVKRAVTEGHSRVIRNNGRLVLQLDVQAYDASLAAAPESASVYC